MPHEYGESSESLLYPSTIERGNSEESTKPISSCKRICSLLCKAIFVITVVLVIAWPSWMVFPRTATLDAGVGHHPLAHTLNGTYAGVYSANFGQNAFLGIPYAKPPIGHLRFQHPQPLTESWNDICNATAYGPHCPAYGVSWWPPTSKPLANYR